MAAIACHGLVSEEYKAVALPHLKMHLQCCRLPDSKALRAGPSFLPLGAVRPTPSTVVPFCRKPVNMTKATVNYRQEKTHMMSAVDRSFTDQSTLQEDERLGLSFMDAPGYSPRGKYWPSQAPGSRVIGQSPGKAILPPVYQHWPRNPETTWDVLALCLEGLRAKVKVMGTPSPLIGHLLFARLGSSSWGQGVETTHP